MLNGVIKMLSAMKLESVAEFSEEAAIPLSANFGSYFLGQPFEAEVLSLERKKRKAAAAMASLGSIGKGAALQVEGAGRKRGTAAAGPALPAPAFPFDRVPVFPDGLYPQSTAPLAMPADWRDFFALTKPRVMTLVVFTGLCGLLAAPGSINPVLGFTAILCIALGAGGAATLNQWWEADIDAG